MRWIRIPLVVAASTAISACAGDVAAPVTTGTSTATSATRNIGLPAPIDAARLPELLLTDEDVPAGTGYRVTHPPSAYDDPRESATSFCNKPVQMTDATGSGMVGFNAGTDQTANRIIVHSVYAFAGPESARAYVEAVKASIGCRRYTPGEPGPEVTIAVEDLSLPGEQSFVVKRGGTSVVKQWVFVRRGRIVSLVDYTGRDEYVEEFLAVATRAAEKLASSNVN